MLRLAGVEGIESWRALPGEVVQPRQLPDGIIEAVLSGDPHPRRFVVEIATYPEERIAEQAASDAVLVWQATGELPEVIVLVLRQRGRKRAPNRFSLRSGSGQTQIQVSWQTVEPWELTANDLLDSGDVGLFPWVPLASSTEHPEQLLMKCRDRILAEASPNEAPGLLAVT